MSDSYALVWRTRWPSTYHFAVAMVLARYQGRNGVCGLKQKTIARLAYCSPRQVASVLQDMREAAPPQVAIEQTFKRDGSRGVNLVRLTLKSAVDSEVDPLVTGDDFYQGPGAYGSDATPTPTQQVQGAGDESGAGAPNNLPSNSKLDSVSKIRESVSGASAPTDDAQCAYEEWNQLAQRLGLPIAEIFTEGRKKKLKKRLAEGGLEGWRRALAAVEASKFLRGLSPGRDGGAPFRANLDFLLQASSFAKVIEGTYGQDAPPARKPADQAATLQARMRGSRSLQASMASRWDQDTASWPEDAGPPPGAPGCVIDADIQQDMQRVRVMLGTQDPVARATGAPLPPTDDSDMLS